MPRSSVVAFDLDRLRSATSLRHVEYHESLRSTSTTAFELLSEIAALTPALVLTAEQTAGRGRTGNVWWSSRGALTFSLVIHATDLPLPVDRRTLVSLAAGMAVRDVLLPLIPEQTVSVKWPNDVLVESQKIAGILVEQHSLESTQMIVIGIGINVNNSLREAPAEVSQRATSVFDLTGQSCDLTEMLVHALNRLDDRIQQFARQPRLALSEVNRHHLLAGRTVTIVQRDSEITGHCIGVDDDGQLVLQNETGLHRCASGVVSRW